MMLFPSVGQDLDEDHRLQVLKGEFFEGNDCLDVGCNSGLITISIAKEFGCRSILGVDIDGASYQKSQGQGIVSEDDPTNTTIFVGNLDSNVTDEQLRQVFGNFGQLLHVKIPAGKRCGFVQFNDRRCAEQAINILNGTQLGGQSIRLSWGRSSSNKQVDSNQWNGGYYGYTSGYETYGYTQPAQDPNFYYAGYTGYGDYPQPTQQQQQPQGGVFILEPQLRSSYYKNRLVFEMNVERT